VHGTASTAAGTPYRSITKNENSYAIKHATGEEILRRLTPLSALQKDILQRLGLGASLYEQLEIQEMRN